MAIQWNNNRRAYVHDHLHCIHLDRLLLVSSPHHEEARAGDRGRKVGTCSEGMMGQAGLWHIKDRGHNDYSSIAVTEGME
jgi:hypothetical protein